MTNDSVELSFFSSAVMRRWYLPVGLALLGLLIGLVVRPPEITEFSEAQTTVLIRPVTDTLLNSNLRLEQLINEDTEREVARSDVVAQAAIASLGAEAPVGIDIDQIQKNLGVEVRTDSQIVVLTYVHRSGDTAAAIVDAMAEQYLNARSTAAIVEVERQAQDLATNIADNTRDLTAANLIIETAEREEADRTDLEGRIARLQDGVAIGQLNGNDEQPTGNPIPILEQRLAALPSTVSPANLASAHTSQSLAVGQIADLRARLGALSTIEIDSGVVLAEARPGEPVVNSNGMIIMAIAAFFGLLLGFILAVILERAAAVRGVHGGASAHGYPQAIPAPGQYFGPGSDMYTQEPQFAPTYAPEMRPRPEPPRPQFTFSHEPLTPPTPPPTAWPTPHDEPVPQPQTAPAYAATPAYAMAGASVPVEFDIVEAIGSFDPISHADNDAAFPPSLDQQTPPFDQQAPPFDQEVWSPPALVHPGEQHASASAGTNHAAGVAVLNGLHHDQPATQAPENPSQSSHAGTAQFAMTQADVAPPMTATNSGLPILADIAKIGRSVQEPVVASDPQSEAAIALRRLAAIVMQECAELATPAILVTSPRPDEGRTTVASNVATALRLAGHNVILVTHAHEHIIAPGVHVLPPGMRVGPDQMFPTPDRLATLLAEAQQLVDIVIIDGPPILTDAQAVGIATVCDRAVIVGVSGRTTTTDVDSAARLIEEAGTRVIGLATTVRPGWISRKLGDRSVS